MKVFVQIPCLNEETTLPLVLQSIPKKIKGVDELVILVIDDGSTDETIQVAKQHGVKHFVVHIGNKGLARSFSDGVHYALTNGADILVNTDGDNQYPQQDIPKLLQPIIDGKADIVIADRQTHKIAHFSLAKKLLQRVGTRVLNAAAGTKIADAPSGFRAYSRESLLQLNVVTRFSYTMETIIQAGNKRMKLISVPVVTNPKTRESRLFNSSFEHIMKSGAAIVRSFVMYRPFMLFIPLGCLLLLLAAVPFLRFLYFELANTPGQNIQSLILGGVLFTAAFIALTLGFIADLIRINRVLQEQSLEMQKRQHYQKTLITNN